MACPYCGSGDWCYEMEGDGSPELIETTCPYITIRRRCECRDCGRQFYVDSAYEPMDWDEPLRVEEVDGNGEEVEE